VSVCLTFSCGKKGYLENICLLFCIHVPMAPWPPVSIYRNLQCSQMPLTCNKTGCQCNSTLEGPSTISLLFFDVTFNYIRIVSCANHFDMLIQPECTDSLIDFCFLLSRCLQAVPAAVTRLGLSTVINHLLGLGTGPTCNPRVL
jgi:hypothetical protein